MQKLLLSLVILAAGAWSSSLAQNNDKKLFPVEVNGLCGYIDNSGRLSIQPIFDSCWKFSEGLACVVIKGRTGFINETGEVVIKPKFNSYHGCYVQFSSGRANVSVGNGRKEQWGFVDTDGRFTAISGVTFLSNFREGLAFFRKDGRTGYLDENLKVAIEPRYKTAGNFYDERARATDLRGNEFYIDKKGNKVFPNNSGGEFQNGRAFFVGNGKYGFIDRMGKITVQSAFNNANHYGEGLAGVKIGDKWGFIDESGIVVIKPQFDEVGVFSEGLVSVALDGKWGFADKVGSLVIAPIFDRFTYYFEGGLCQIRLDGKIGYIDPRGQYVWPPTQ